jgi:hypothetical protein
MSTPTTVPLYAHRLVRVTERLQQEFPERSIEQIKACVERSRTTVTDAARVVDYATYALRVETTARTMLAKSS